MSMGHVQQVGTPLELYDSPANLFVASFIGLPPMNFFDVRVDGGKLVGDQFTTVLSPEDAALLASYNGKTITLGIRPENITAGGDITMKVVTNENLGMNTLVHGHLGSATDPANKITAKLRGWCNYANGDVVPISFNKMHFFDKETTNAIGRK
jgi:multiple sugar transport system ATP-binding protein